MALSDVTLLITDGSHYSPATTAVGKPYITVRDVYGGRINFEKSARISQSDFEILRNNGCQPAMGDVLFSKDGTVGRVALVADEVDFVVLSSLAILRPDTKRVSPEYLSIALTSERFQAEATDRKSGLAIRRVVLKTLRQLTIPVPPLLVQRRIVDLVASVDAYIAGLEKQAEAARTARNAVLHELLTADGKDWTKTTLGECCQVVTSRQSPASLPAKTRYVGLEHVDSKSIRITRFGEVSEVTSQVTPFAPGDTLFGRLRPYLNKVSKADIHGVCSPEILVLRAKGDCSSDFLYLLASSEFTVSKCVEMSAGTRMPRTSSTDLCSIGCLLPPKTEQRRIVGVVSSMDELILSSERVLPLVKQLRAGLLSDLLSGEHAIPESYDKFLGAA